MPFVPFGTFGTFGMSNLLFFVVINSHHKNMTMREKLILTSLPVGELETLIIDCVNACLKHYKPSQQPKEEPETYLTKKEAAQIAKVATSTIDNWGRAEYITRYYFGSSVRFKKAELLEYLENQRVRTV